MTTQLTRVVLVSVPRRINVYLRFGTPFKVVSLDRHRRDAYFAPGQVFCRVWWQGDNYGTVHWQLDVLQAKGPRDLLQTRQGVAPGVASLLSVRAQHRVKAVLRAIDAIESQGLDPKDASLSYWRVLHNRLAAGGSPTSYGLDRHAAETLRCRLA